MARARASSTRFCSPVGKIPNRFRPEMFNLEIDDVLLHLLTEDRFLAARGQKGVQ